MTVTYDDVEIYLKKAKDLIHAGRYRIEMNEKRQDNQTLLMEYAISEKQIKEILLDLTPMDFSEIRLNDHKGYEHEKLYVFGKDVNLLPRFGCGEEKVSLYIKFNMLESKFVIVVSFHQQKYPIKYQFK